MQSSRCCSLLRYSLSLLLVLDKELRVVLYFIENVFFSSVVLVTSEWTRVFEWNSAVLAIETWHFYYYNGTKIIWISLSRIDILIRVWGCSAWCQSPKIYGNKIATTASYHSRRYFVYSFGFCITFACSLDH